MDITTLLLIAAILGALYYIFTSQKKKNGPMGRESSKTWSINWSTGFPDTPPLVGKGWRIAFPAGPQAHLHYVQKYSELPELRVGGSLTILVEVTGGPFVAIEYPENPAKVSLMIQRKGDRMTEAYVNYRWFSNTSIPLVPGQHLLTVTLDTQHFGDVYGGRDEDAFRAALDNAESIGILFGSDGGLGHGVYAREPGSVELLSLA